MSFTFTRRHAAGIALATTILGGFEGLSNYAYKDPVGIPTICWGETRDVHMGDYRTTPQCQAMLGERVTEFAQGVDKCLPPDVPEKSYGAFVSAAYNIGLGAFCGSSMAKRAAANDLPGACTALLSWDKARVAGVLVALPGLTKRRQEEYALCMQGVAG